MRSLVQISLSVGILAMACGCAGKGAAAAGPSTVSGTAALSTFPTAPTSITARDESGRLTVAKLATDGSFSMVLDKGHTYKLQADLTGRSVPLVFPRQSGKLDLSFSLKTDGASLRLGHVHYLSRGPATGFQVSMNAGQSGSQSGDQCTDCVDDNQQVSCGGGDGADGTESSGGSEANGGSESSTGAESNGGGTSDSAEQADANAEMAVGDQNAPEQVDGCDSQGGDNSDGQQEGEH